LKRPLGKLFPGAEELIDKLDEGAEMEVNNPKPLEEGKNEAGKDRRNVFSVVWPLTARAS